MVIGILIDTLYVILAVVFIVGAILVIASATSGSESGVNVRGADLPPALKGLHTNEESRMTRIQRPERELVRRIDRALKTEKKGASK